MRYIRHTLLLLLQLLVLGISTSCALFGGKRQRRSFCSRGIFSSRRQREASACDDLIVLRHRGGNQESSVVKEDANDAVVQLQNESIVATKALLGQESSTETKTLVKEHSTTTTTTLVQNEAVSQSTTTESCAVKVEITTSNKNSTDDVATTIVPAWKADLPPLLQQKGNRTLQRLLLGNVEIFLLGTAHVSNDSCRDVQVLLESVHPACIFVELCDARIPLLEGEGSDQDTQVPKFNEDHTSNTTTTNKKLPWGQRVAHIQESQGGSKWQAICTLLLTSVQEDYAETLGVELGGEFRAAHEYWKTQRRQIIHNDKLPTTPAYHHQSQFPVLILGDRPLSLTLVRAWESLRWWPKLKVMLGLVWSSFSKPNPEDIRAWLESVLREESDVLTESLAELRQHFPTLHTTIIAERDAWLACKLVQTCRVLRGVSSSSPSGGGPRTRLVAIVGAGHVPGIVQMLTGNNPAYSPDQTTEDILHSLCQTRRWQNDNVVQKEVIPTWVHDVPQVQDPVF